MPWGASDSVNRRGAARRSGVRVRAAALPPSEHSCTRAAPPCLTTQHLPRLRLSAQQPSYALSLCIGTSVGERCDATQQACRLPGASPCRCCRPNLLKFGRLSRLDPAIPRVYLRIPSRQRPSPPMLVTISINLSISRLSNKKCCDRGWPISFFLSFFGPCGHPTLPIAALRVGESRY